MSIYRRCKGSRTTRNRCDRRNRTPPQYKEKEIKNMIITEREKQGFAKYLFLIGYNNNGVQEILQRIKENRPDFQDNTLYRRYLEENRR